MRMAASARPLSARSCRPPTMSHAATAYGTACSSGMTPALPSSKDVIQIAPTTDSASRQAASPKSGQSRPVIRFTPQPSRRRHWRERSASFDQAIASGRACASADGDDRSLCKGMSLEQLRVQRFQRADVVHVVPLRQDVHGQAKLAGTIQRLARHVLRAPGNVLEQTLDVSPSNRASNSRRRRRVRARHGRRAAPAPPRSRPEATWAAWGCRS